MGWKKEVWPLQGASKDCPTDRNNKIEDQESCVNDQSPERSRRAEGEKVHNLELLPAGMIHGKIDVPKDQIGRMSSGNLAENSKRESF